MPAAGNSTAAPAPGAQVAVHDASRQLIATCAAKESALKALLTERAFYEQPVRMARQQLGQAYEALLLQDYNAAQARALASDAVQCLAACGTGEEDPRLSTHL